MSATTEADYIRVCQLEELPTVGAAKAEVSGRITD